MKVIHQLAKLILRIALLRIFGLLARSLYVLFQAIRRGDPIFYPPPLPRWRSDPASWEQGDE